MPIYTRTHKKVLNKTIKMRIAQNFIYIHACKNTQI